MSFNLAILGLPHSGKSTVFKALTQVSPANKGSEPNLAKVAVKDPRIDAMQKFFNSPKIVPHYLTVLDFAPFAGLEAKPDRNELGGRFLAQIKESDAILAVLKAFTGPDGEEPHPEKDAEAINLEMLLSDLKIVEGVLERKQKMARVAQKEAQQEVELLTRIKTALSQDQPIRELELTPQEQAIIKNYSFLTQMPVIYLLNLGEGRKPEEFPLPQGISALPVYAQLEAELQDLSPEDAALFAQELGLEQDFLPRIISEGFRVLNRITFFTSGEKEVHAWSVKAGSTALEAAGKIHTDLQRGFIRAEVIEWDKMLELGGCNKAKETGDLRLEGKDYKVKEGEVIVIRFNC